MGGYSVANATALQVANATDAVATVGLVKEAPDQEWRRARLAELTKIEHFGGRAALGRALGYKEGAFVRQMIAGERPISEKTVSAIEQLHNGKYRGWFDRPLPSAPTPAPPLSTEEPAPRWEGGLKEPAPPPRNFADRREASDSDWALLQDMKDALEAPHLAERVAALRREVDAMREFARRHFQERVSTEIAGSTSSKKGRK